jgi:hypothetical protein
VCQTLDHFPDPLFSFENPSASLPQNPSFLDYNSLIRHPNPNPPVPPTISPGKAGVPPALRNTALETSEERESGMAIVESLDKIEDSPGRTSTTKTARGSETSSFPPVTPARLEELKFKRKQQEILTSWIDDPRHAADATCRHALELYAQLNDSEFLYVSDLQSTYDEARCFFLQWVLGKEIKELVNSARISAVQAGKKFTWRHARAEVLRSLTDITYTVRYLALARLKRQSGSATKLWISKVLTRKALLEDPKLPSPIVLPESLYLELLVGQMSAQETTVFDCPSIGDDLSAKDHRGSCKVQLSTNQTIYR